MANAVVHLTYWARLYGPDCQFIQPPIKHTIPLVYALPSISTNAHIVSALDIKSSEMRPYMDIKYSFAN